MCGNKMSNNDEDLERAKNKFKKVYAESSSKVNVKPLLGEITGLLIFEDRPVSMQEIAEETGYSLSHVSNILNNLKQRGYIKEIRKPGDRKNYYESLDIDTWIKESSKGLLEHSKIIIKGTEECIDMIEDEEKEEYLQKIKNRHKNLKKSIKLLDVIPEDELGKLFEKYEIE